MVQSLFHRPPVHLSETQSGGIFTTFIVIHTLPSLRQTSFSQTQMKYKFKNPSPSFDTCEGLLQILLSLNKISRHTILF